MSLSLICKLVSVLTFSIFIVAGTGCASVHNAKIDSAVSIYNSKADELFISEFTKSLNLPHIVLRCRVFDLQGREIASLKSHLCWFGNDGRSVKADHGIAVGLDQKSSVEWTLAPTAFHHMMSKSEFGDEFLTLNSEYKTFKNYPQVRHDELIVFNRSGKIIKKFRMSGYLAKNVPARPPSVDSWSFSLPEGQQAWEYTHGNTLKETWSIQNGIKKHNGYIFFDNQERVLYFLNRQLNKVVRTISSGGRPLHDIQQYDEHHLVAYGNSAPPGNYGGIYLINLKNGSLEMLYRFNHPLQLSEACSSVQILPGKKFFLVHSRCNVEDPETIVEFVDLESGRNAFLKLDTAYSMPSGHLANLNSYFENNYSH